jgi:amino acid adenylation domain-containing protein
LSITEAEQQLLYIWNATTTSFSIEKCIHQLFEEQSERTPEVIAIVCEDEQLTYRELNQRANQLAHYLQRSCVKPETLVGLCMSRSLDMVVGILGILKAGGAYVPLDPTYPKERFAFLIQDSQPSVLLTQEKHLSKLPELKAKIICLDTQWETISQEESDNTHNGVTPENLVYVIYTSGSTGTPKGILIQHKSLVNYAQYACDAYEIHPGDRVLQFASINFDASAEEIYPCLISGATLVLRTEKMLNSVATFLETCDAWRITLLDLPTAYWHEIVLGVAEEGLAIPASLRVVIIGGERALPERLKLWQQHVGRKVRLFNTYGPTETTIVVMVAELTEVELDQGEVSIGRPIANTQIYLLDASLRPVPIGMPGEMYVGGVGLARGYYHRPELTAERFIPHPFSNEPYTFLYKTGDLARYRKDGEIEFLGRVDNQVKIRGFRIELEEIEVALRRHLSVRDAIVLAREDIPGEKHLVAYVIPFPEQHYANRDLRNFLKELLPEYMIPSAFVRLDTFPLMPNGKIDRGAFPPPSTTRERDDDDYVAPKSMLHHQLIAIWEELLHIQPIGIADNFFYLGGHSLLAARMVASIEQVCGKKLSPAVLFAGPTIEQIAEALQREEGPKPRISVVAVQRGKSQQPFFFLHGDPTGGAFYCFQLAHSLGEDKAFYVLEPYRFDDLLIPPTMEMMASAYIEQIRSIQPEGPYLIGGWCDGGLMAYEIARQLTEQGQGIDQLVLMDPAVVSPFSKLLHSIICHSHRLFRLSEDKQIAWFLRLLYMYELVRLIPGRRQVAKFTKNIEELRPQQKKEEKSFLKSLFPSREELRSDYRNVYTWVCLEYAVRPIACNISILWAEQEPFGGVWKRKVAEEPQIKLYFTPGDHMTCRTDHLLELKKRFREIVQQVQSIKSD